MISELRDICPIWGTAARRSPVANHDSDSLYSPRTGGSFIITRSAESIARSELNDESRLKLTSWLVVQRRQGIESPIITTTVIKDIVVAKRLSFSQKKLNFFQCLIEANLELGTRLTFIGSTDERDLKFCAWTESKTMRQLCALASCFAEQGLLTSDNGSTFMISASGLEFIEQLSAGTNSKQVFVAMWFDETLDPVYERGISAAIVDAGLTPMRIDKKDHANKICDEIVAEIRRSRFVIADFTCGFLTMGADRYALPRGGVYYEAGFAQGLGLPVIWTCRNTSIDQVHFDTRQYNHIVWEDAEDLRVALRNRILALGLAP